MKIGKTVFEIFSENPQGAIFPLPPVQIGLSVYFLLDFCKLLFSEWRVEQTRKQNNLTLPDLREMVDPR